MPTDNVQQQTQEQTIKHKHVRQMQHKPTTYNSFQLNSCILTTRFLTGGQTSDNLSVLHSQCSNTIHCCGTRSNINQSTSTHAYLQEMHEACHSKTACHKTDMKHAITKLLTHTCGLSRAHVQPLLNTHTMNTNKNDRPGRARSYLPARTWDASAGFLARDDTLIHTYKTN